MLYILCSTKKLGGYLFVILVLISMLLTTTVLAAPQTLGGSAVTGNLQITVNDDGSMMVERYATGTWLQQVETGPQKGSRLQIGPDSTNGWSLGYYSGPLSPTQLENTLSGNSITSRWQAGDVEVTQVTTYIDGNNYYRVDWYLENTGTSTLNDLRFFHGENSYLDEDTSGGGFYDSTSGMVGVYRVDGTSLLQASLQSDPNLSPPSAYDSENAVNVRNHVENGELLNRVNSNQNLNNGWAMQWNKVTLEPGESWHIGANQGAKATPGGDVIVTAPFAVNCVPGVCDLYFQVTNVSNSTQNVDLATTLAQAGWSASIVSPDPSTGVSITSNQTITVHVELTIPAETPTETTGNVFLSATVDGTTAEDFTQVVVITPPTEFTSSTPPNGNAGDTYTYTFAANGSPAPSYAVVAGALPPGLELNSSTGEIFGTPTTPGVYSGIVIRATNQFGYVDTDPFTITITSDTTTTLLADPTSAVFGEEVTLTATVSANFGIETPTGDVEFYDGAVLLETVSLSGGEANFTTSSLTLGDHTFSAVYLGTTIYNSSTSDDVTLPVSQASPIVGLSVDPSPSGFGETVTLTATVTAQSPGSGTPSGQIEFYDGATLLDTVILVAGVANYQTDTLSIGQHTLSAQYSGDTNFLASTSADFLHTVVASSTTTSLATDMSPSVYGQDVTFTAVVTPSDPNAGVLDGQVEFRDGTFLLGTVDLEAGSAQFSTFLLGVGDHSITAVYLGNASYGSSTSPVVIQTVNKASTTLVVNNLPNPSEYGDVITFTATVSPQSPGSGEPQGQVQFWVDGTLAATVDMSAGSAVYEFSGLDVGTHTVSVTYLGSGSYNESTFEITQIVGPDKIYIPIINSN